MAYTTQLQQVIAYLKNGGKITPPTGPVPVMPQVQPPALPFGNTPVGAAKPGKPPPKVSK